MGKKSSISGRQCSTRYMLANELGQGCGFTRTVNDGETFGVDRKGA